MKTILFIVGARPNFPKVSALIRAAEPYLDRIKPVIIHTGQHYNDELSKIFFEQFNIPPVYANLEVGSMDRISLTHAVMDRLEYYLKELTPSAVVVVGDVTSTAAATLASIRNSIPVVHVEAGLRSYNWRMPEEINRVMTDHLSSLLFVTEKVAVENLKKEGIDQSRIYLVGNVMIDTFNQFDDLAEKSDVLSRLNLDPYSYALGTLHRPENVDNQERFMELYGTLCEINSIIPLVIALHPRTQEMSRKFGINWESRYAPTVIPPQSYLDFFKLQRYSRFVITDSGGVQEETSVIGVPCITIRTETERPITCEYGTNEVVGVSREKIIFATKRAVAGVWKRRRAVIPFWDGHASERIMKILVDELYSNKLSTINSVANFENASKTSSVSDSKKEIVEKILQMNE